MSLSMPLQGYAVIRKYFIRTHGDNIDFIVPALSCMLGFVKTTDSCKKTILKQMQMFIVIMGMKRFVADICFLSNWQHFCGWPCFLYWHVYNCKT